MFIWLYYLTLCFCCLFFIFRVSKREVWRTIEKRRWVEDQVGPKSWTWDWTCPHRLLHQGASPHRGGRTRCHHQARVCPQRRKVGVARRPRPWCWWGARGASCMWCCQRMIPSVLNARAPSSLIFFVTITITIIITVGALRRQGRIRLIYYSISLSHSLYRVSLCLVCF